MASKTNIFFTGATGFIGGNFLQRLLEHPSFDTFKITALVRSEAKADKLKSFKITPAIGSLDDLDLVERLASESDVVIATADADHLPATLATLRGLKKRYETSGKVPIFIHTSGTALFTQDTRGELHDQETYDDDNADQMEALPPTRIHRDVDLAIVTAGQEGYVRTYIVIPSLIYGIAKGALVDAQIANGHSLALPKYLIPPALAQGKAGMYGPGKNLWPHVHIEENSDLYVLVLDGALKNAIGHGREGYYIAANGHVAGHEVAQAIAEALVKVGKSTKAEPSSFTEEEIQKYFGGGYVLGSSGQVVANRSFSIGWKPKKTTQDLLDSVLAEVEAAIAAQAQKSS